MKKATLSLFVWCVLVLAISCGPKLSTTKMTDKNLENYETYAYLPNTNFEVSEQLNGQKTKVANEIIEAMNKNMERAGYQIDREEPDLLILLTTIYDKERVRRTDAAYAIYPYTRAYTPARRVSPYYSNYYYGNYANNGPYEEYTIGYSNYKTGTLVVDIIDRKTKNRLWTGTAEDTIYKQDSSEKVAKFVDDIFDEYPTISTE